jgi:hypothetical protein
MTRECAPNPLAERPLAWRAARGAVTWAPTLRVGQHQSAPRLTTSNIAMATRQTKTQTVKTSEATQHQEHVMLLCPRHPLRDRQIQPISLSCGRPLALP